MVKELKKSRKTQYTEMVLKDSLMDLMKEKPISKITVKEICGNADINRTTFYAHYSDQYDLLNTIEDETIQWAKEKLDSIFETDKKEARKIIESIFEYLIENSNYIQVLMSEQEGTDFPRKLFSLIYEECNRVLPASNKLNINFERDEYYFIFVVNGSVGIIQHWLKTGLTKTAEEMADVIYNVALK